MNGVLIPTYGQPTDIDIRADGSGGTLRALQQLVGGNIELFDAVFDEDICLYVNDEGLHACAPKCAPNRAIYATRSMEESGYLSQMDYSTSVKEGELYTILFGDIVAVGFDPETGEDRDLTHAEADEVKRYFSEVSGPGSGAFEVMVVRWSSRQGERRRDAGLAETASGARRSADALSGNNSPHDAPEAER